MLDRANINKIPRFKSASVIGIGRGVQIIKAKKRAMVGVIIKRVGDDEDGRTGSLMKSLTPSAIGCSRP